MWLVDRLSAVLGDRERTEAEIAVSADRQRRWALARLAQEPDVSLLVMGHTHRAIVEEVENGRRYVNPGAWFDGYRYAVADSSRVTLAQFAP
jgi:UDP-2,3-diacylglucosamine pyrophosphatase LpxH